MNRILAAVASMMFFVACGGQPASGTSTQSAEGLASHPSVATTVAARPAVRVPVAALPSGAPVAATPAIAPVDSPVPLPSPVVPTVELHTSSADQAGPWQSDFNINTTYDVFLATDLDASFQGHLSLSVDVFMPGNGAYQNFTTAIAVGVPADPGEQQAVQTKLGWRVWNTLPVAGTFIEQYSLSGPWTATAYLGNLSANASFNLN